MRTQQEIEAELDRLIKRRDYLLTYYVVGSGLGIVLHKIGILKWILDEPVIESTTIETTADNGNRKDGDNE